MLLSKPGALDRSTFTCLVFKGLLLSLTTLDLHHDIPVRQWITVATGHYILPHVWLSM